MTLAEVTLDDKYTLDRGRIFLTGTQALVRLPMMQRQRDLAAGLNTAGYVTGYRGSPLGGLDQQLAAREALPRPAPHRASSRASTRTWRRPRSGAPSRLELPGEGKYDGVFGIWYGKGPGVDRTGDAFKHGNLAGTSPHGRRARADGRRPHLRDPRPRRIRASTRSSTPMIPVLNPAGVQEILDFGLLRLGAVALLRLLGRPQVRRRHGRHHGLGRASTRRAIQIVLPDGLRAAAGRAQHPLARPAARAGGAPAHATSSTPRGLRRANRLRPHRLRSPAARLGIVTAGKSYLDVRQALDDLGIDEARPSGSACASTRSA